MNEEGIGISADIEDLVDTYQARMTREKAQVILARWQEKPKSDWVEERWFGENETKLDGAFTADELEAFAWCMRNDVKILDLANGL